ncbi:MAG: tRNA pseudouridine32 synthase/23S rRNA pseudouridine746 synthase [Candidatus Endobugula sp.]|jgi:tRNA pseudouridine32 synthase/23S rRNA pseudouridine746 synthase
MSTPIDHFVAPVCHQDIEILFQDEHLLVMNKPSGLLSLSGKNPLNKDSVHHRLVQQFPTAHMVHRLDLGTSGLMVLALNKSVNGHLTKQFQQRTVKKIYTAVLYGRIEDEQGCIDIPIIKDKLNFPYQKVCEETGKVALSQYEVVGHENGNGEAPPSSRVLFSPQTGRTHQLRIHAREIGHPILGCDLYGATIAGVTTQSMAERLLLHATRLEFVHPVSGETMLMESTCPF